MALRNSAPAARGQQEEAPGRPRPGRHAGPRRTPLAITRTNLRLVCMVFLLSLCGGMARAHAHAYAAALDEQPAYRTPGTPNTPSTRLELPPDADGGRGGASAASGVMAGGDGESTVGAAAAEAGLGHGCHSCSCLPSCRSGRCNIVQPCSASRCTGHCKWPNSSSQGRPIGACRLDTCSHLNPGAAAALGFEFDGWRDALAADI